MSGLEGYWENVDKNGPIPKNRPELGPCWIWTGATNKKGYGVYRLNGSLQYVHRIALSLKVGQLPSSKQSCHKCDNPPCANWDHLYVGTNTTNQRDAYRRRRRIGKGTPPVAKGEAHWKHKLTAEKVKTIRELAASGVPQLQIASAMSVNQSTIQRILAGKAWTSVK
jgi:hypothetical protein